MVSELCLEMPWSPSCEPSKFEIIASLLSHFKLQLYCQSLDLIVLIRMVAELCLEMPWSPSYEPSKFGDGKDSQNTFFSKFMIFP